MKTKSATLSKIFLATILTAAVGATGFGGFKAGSYWTAMNYEKAAIAHECATLNPKEDNKFAWKLPITMDATEEAAEQAAQEQDMAEKEKAAKEKAKAKNPPKLTINR